MRQFVAALGLWFLLGSIGCGGGGGGGPTQPDPPSNPVITAVTPTTLVGGDIVTVSGSNFGNNLANVTVKFGSQNGQVLSVTPTSLSVRVPTSASGNLQVVVT